VWVWSGKTSWLPYKLRIRLDPTSGVLQELTSPLEVHKP
jgi:hypothetical protein